MLIEIFGFPTELVVCPSCMRAKALCETNNLEYKFHPVITDIVQGRSVRNMPVVHDLMRRLNLKDADLIHVPTIFVDDIHIGNLADFRIFLRDLNLKTTEVI